MAPLSAIIAFSIAAGLLTITPGLDTALVLRTATVEGAGRAMQAGAGIVAGVLCWGLVASVGLGAVLTASQFGYRLLQYGGAAYIVWLGARLVLDASRSAKKESGTPGDQWPGARQRNAGNWFGRGLMTNLLNPKVGIFYVGFLPQFIPPDVPVVTFGIALAALHALMGLMWFAVIAMATRPFARLVRSRRFARGVDGLTGSVLIAFGLRLAFESRG
ncbi:LysE family translocator [Breoghania sp. JC706]|uniref:LysE family translocator n=1 Tax=Breoghania sp. JC706 TaxID=3117732 RepID=UPI00300A72D8